jgi:uncharacterized UPF0160 family protein
MKLENIKKIVVHNGTFHADDAMVVAMVRAFSGKLIPVERVPHQADISYYLEDPKILVADVGRRYEPEMLNFDHHQFKQPEEENRAAAGMVFDWLVEQGVINSILEKNLRPLIKMIDENDIGVRPAQVGELPNIVAGFNRVENETAQEAAFEYVIDMLMRIIGNYIVEAAKELKAQVAAEKGEEVVPGVLKVNVDGTAPYLILNYIAEHGPENIDIIYWQDLNTKEWKAQVVPEAPGSFKRRGRGFQVIDPLPEGIKFVHKAQFFMVAENENVLLDYIKNYTK